MRRVVFLARHGETEWNREGRWQGHTDVELNATGHGQARALAETLRAHAVERIHTSDLLRARQTAEAVASALGVRNLIVDRALRERSFGIFEGLTRDECQRRHPDLWARYRANPRDVPPGAETHDILAARMHAAIKRALFPDSELSPDPERSPASPGEASAGGAARPSEASGAGVGRGGAECVAPSQGPELDRPVLIVSHGGSIRALLSHLTGTMPPPLENVAVFRAVATVAGLEEIVLLPPAS